ncbi:MAG: ATP synthase F1 subunit epsilon [Defluviitaleaceae bacterium]|nr:ATP synthase F1 subunit epsilon [Defluviitaleaceae bacterium]
MNKITVRIVTPDEALFEGAVSGVHAPGVDGGFSVLGDHAPMISLLKAGVIRLKVQEAADVYVGIDGGILEVSHNQVNILAQTGLRSDHAGVMEEMETRQQARSEEAMKKRNQLIKSEMELYRLLSQLNKPQ